MRYYTWPGQGVSGGCCRASFRRLPPCRTISMLGATTAFWSGSTSNCWWKRAKPRVAKPAPRPGSSTANPSRPPRAAAPAGMMLAKKSKDASAISSPIRLASSSAPRFTPPIFKTAMAPRSSSKPFTISSPGCATSSPIVPIPATNWRRLSPDSAAGRSRSSNETLPASSCFPAGGWSNALSLGSIATAAWPKTLRLRSPVPRLGSTSLASNSSLGDWRMVETTYTIKIQTLSDVTAQKEYGVTRDFIVKGVQAGELEFREGAVWGNPYLRVLRSQLERYIVAQLGSEYLLSKKSHNELHNIRKEIAAIRKKLAVLEARKAALECAIKT